MFLTPEFIKLINPTIINTAEPILDLLLCYNLNPNINWTKEFIEDKKKLTSSLKFRHNQILSDYLATVAQVRENAIQTAAEIKAQEKELSVEYHNHISSILKNIPWPREMSTIVTQFIITDLYKELAERRLTTNKTIRFWKINSDQKKDSTTETPAPNVVNHTNTSATPQAYPTTAIAAMPSNAVSTSAYVNTQFRP